ncbi:MAG: PEP-CTERM sorting domain-containing protein [Acidobacteriales bacterium]|nr:MAG: PEP-CTERM sorting domain-containing protein [Terriglobales bacterium]
MRFARLLALLTILTATASASLITFTVDAFIDGRSLLIFQGDTLQWHNLTYNAPGIPSNPNEDYPTIITSTLNSVVQINAVSWYPDWPGGTSSDVYSSTFTGLNPDMPGAEIVSVGIAPLQARYILGILQSPNAGNGYTLILDFNDDAPGGGAWYGALVSIETADAGVPEPTSIVLAGAGLALLYWWRRREA